MLSARMAYSTLVLWCHMHEVLVLLCRLGQLYLHAQIATKLIFSSWYNPWISISCHQIFTLYYVRKYLTYLSTVPKLHLSSNDTHMWTMKWWWIDGNMVWQLWRCQWMPHISLFGNWYDFIWTHLRHHDSWSSSLWLYMDIYKENQESSWIYYTNFVNTGGTTGRHIDKLTKLAL